MDEPKVKEWPMSVSGCGDPYCRICRAAADAIKNSWTRGRKVRR